MLPSEVPAEVAVDPHWYAAWRYNNLSEDEAAALKSQGLSVATILAIFRDEWRVYHVGALPPSL